MLQPAVLNTPGSMQSFSGFRLPYWNEALELCLQAHSMFSDFPSVCWDVAFTPEGPVLVEGNHDWDVVLAQEPGCGPPGGQTLLPAIFRFCVDHTIARERMLAGVAG